MKKDKKSGKVKMTDANLVVVASIALTSVKVVKSVIKAMELMRRNNIDVSK